MVAMQIPTKSRAVFPSRQGAGLVWLILALAVLGIASVVFLAPDLPRRLMGTPAKPADRGSDPEIVAAAKPTPPPTKTDPTPKTPIKAPVDTAPTPSSEKPAAPVVAKAPADEAAAATILAEARSAYRSFQWSKAILTANRITASSMDVSSATRQHAKDIQHGASTLEKMFAALNAPDELSRGFDTHPCLVEITTKGATSFAVPMDASNKPILPDQDPIAVIEQQKSAGKVRLMYKSRASFVPATLEPDNIDLVKRADLKSIMATYKTDLAARIANLNAGSEAGQSLMWYEAARFAYRNRLDEQVTQLMDKALELDAELATTVREDRAATLLGHMLIKLKEGNKPQAASYLNVINKRFADTDSGKKAVAFYAGETGKLIALEKEAEDRRIKAEEARLKMIKERELALGVKAAPLVAKADTTTDTMDLKPVTGDELLADTMTEEGRLLCSKAIEAPLGKGKNDLYKQAYQVLFKSKALYASLAKKNPSNQGLQPKMLLAGQLLYMAKKGLSPFN